MSNIKGQDILVLLKILVKEQNFEHWSYSKLAEELCMSSSEVHAALKRAHKSRLIDNEKNYVVHSALLEFMVHGVKYCFPPELGKQTRGIPTGYAAPFMQETIMQGNDLPPVWPYAEGTVKGISLQPIYRSVPDAAVKDDKLYELLALVDMIRSGRARERAIAEDRFTKILSE